MQHTWFAGRTSRRRTARAAVSSLLVLAACTGCSSDDAATTSTSTSAPASSTSDPAATTTAELVPQTSGPPATAGPGGEIGVDVRPPVGIDEVAEFGGDVDLVMTAIEPVEVGADRPGETAGAAIAVSFEVRNDSDAPIDLGLIVVDAVDGDGVPAVSNSSDPADAFSGELSAGETADGTFVFRTSADLDELLVSAQASFSRRTLRFQV